jgi:hypothetical protein
MTDMPGSKKKPNIYINPNASPFVRDVLCEIFQDANEISAEEMNDRMHRAQADPNVQVDMPSIEADLDLVAKATGKPDASDEVIEKLLGLRHTFAAMLNALQAIEPLVTFATAAYRIEPSAYNYEALQAIMKARDLALAAIAKATAGDPGSEF